MAKMNGGAPQPVGTADGSAQQTVLVFQGGGALGAYQAGVYQALHEAGVEPDWIIGTSIGAINAALIAGNAPGNRLARLEEFWRRMAHKSIWHASVAWPQLAQAWSYWNTLSCGIPDSSNSIPWPSGERTHSLDPSGPATIRRKRSGRRSVS